VAASAGGVAALRTLVRALPDRLPAAIVFVLHRPRHHRSHLTQILQRCTAMPVVTARNGESIVSGVVYVASAQQQLTVPPDRHCEYRDPDGRLASNPS
jgi:chemotaxis response regulator CheB